jgi:hypothetical protein
MNHRPGYLLEELRKKKILIFPDNKNISAKFFILAELILFSGLSESVKMKRQNLNFAALLLSASLNIIASIFFGITTCSQEATCSGLFSSIKFNI